MKNKKQNSELDRFIQAQDINYAKALNELRHGRKTSCWMWYVFPQIAGLGKTVSAKTYEIKDLDEAEDYVAHPLLGRRLQDACEAALNTESSDAEYVFGYPDNLKLQSSMTLFSIVEPDNPIYQDVLDKFFDGEQDEKTIHILMENGWIVCEDDETDDDSDEDEEVQDDYHSQLTVKKPLLSEKAKHRLIIVIGCLFIWFFLYGRNGL